MAPGFTKAVSSGDKIILNSLHHFATSALCKTLVASLGTDRNAPFVEALQQKIVSPTIQNPSVFKALSRPGSIYPILDINSDKYTSTNPEAAPLSISAAQSFRSVLQAPEKIIFDTKISRPAYIKLLQELTELYVAISEPSLRLIGEHEKSQRNWRIRLEQLSNLKLVAAGTISYISLLSLVYLIVPRLIPLTDPAHRFAAFVGCITASLLSAILVRNMDFFNPVQHFNITKVRKFLRHETLNIWAQSSNSSSHYLAATTPLFEEGAQVRDGKSNKDLTKDDELAEVLTQAHDPKNLRYLVMEFLQSSDSDEVFVRGSIRHQPLIREAPWK
jgi:hypothetical protein